MAEPIGIASGLLALATFAFQSSVSLYRAIESFQSNKKIIRELKQELEALDGVLESLQQATANNVIGLPALKLPLLRCGQACQEFEAAIVKCTAHSGGSRTNFRDWAKLKYMGDDILGFKNMIAGYKSTINIALGDANFRSAAVTAEVLKEYKDMITNTTSDLEEHLQEIEGKLQTLPLRGDTISDEGAAERERIQEEKDSTQQCLVICAQVSEQLSQLRPNVFEDVSAAKFSHQVDVTALAGLVPAKRITAKVLQEFQEKLSNTASGLQEHLRKIDNRLHALALPRAGISGEGAAERKRVQEEKDSIKQCLAICAQASEQADLVQSNVFEDVSAAQEAHQLIVATLGDLISAQRVTAELRATQWLGQMSDATIQQLSRDQGIALRGRAAMDKVVEPQTTSDASFTDQYGAGHKLG